MCTSSTVSGFRIWRVSVQKQARTHCLCSRIPSNNVVALPAEFNVVDATAYLPTCRHFYIVVEALLLNKCDECRYGIEGGRAIVSLSGKSSSVSHFCVVLAWTWTSKNMRQKSPRRIMVLGL